MCKIKLDECKQTSSCTSTLIILWMPVSNIIYALYAYFYDMQAT